MTVQSLKGQLQICLQAIERKLSWGPAENWSNYDFIKLSELIFEASGVRLSATTLKRVWGRIRYKNSPTTTTLNALAQYSGAEDWRSFTRQHPLDSKAVPARREGITNPSQATSPGKKTHPTRRAWIAGSALILIFVFTGFLVSLAGNSEDNPKSSDFEFTANKVYTKGVPNSVIFTYDARAAKTDSVFIIQTWDYSRKTLVPREETHHSAIYYYPGFFRTALVVDGKIVKKHDLQISTDGWLGLVEIPGKPYYFKKSEIVEGDTVAIGEELLRANKFELMPVAPKVRLFNQRDLGNLNNDNFEFHIELKNDFNAGNNACQNVEVLIQCKDDIIIVPLIAPSCVGDASLYIPGKEIKSLTADLSGFGADLSDWTALEVVCVDRHIQFSVNGREALASTLLHDPTGIVGVQVRFNGPGAVRDVWFKGREGFIKL